MKSDVDNRSAFFFLIKKNDPALLFEDYKSELGNLFVSLKGNRFQISETVDSGKLRW